MPHLSNITKTQRVHISEFSGEAASYCRNRIHMPKPGPAERLFWTLTSTSPSLAENTQAEYGGHFLPDTYTW